MTYEVANPLQAIEQLTVTTLRNVIGGMTLEQTLTCRDQINAQLRVVLDEATGKWGIRINRVELKSVDPPPTIQEAMEKQMRAERDRRAAILTAEGVKQSQILTAEGEKQSAVLKAEGAKTAAILRSEGEAKAIDTVFNAIHAGRPDRELLSYQYLQMLPQLAQGDGEQDLRHPERVLPGAGQPRPARLARAARDDDSRHPRRPRRSSRRARTRPRRRRPPRRPRATPRPRPRARRRPAGGPGRPAPPNLLATPPAEWWAGALAAGRR